MSLPELALRDAGVTFGGRPLFSGVDVAVGRGERLCLVGRNGSGKSTLLKALAGLIEIDQGARFLQPGRRVAYMAQEPVASAALTVADYVAAGAGAVAPIQPAEAHRVQALLAEIGLAGDRPLATLSGGEERRAALARALAGEPDILLLDEPTNHLDLPTVEWLERRLADFPGGVLLISHDRAFLTALTKVTLWLDRGRLRRMEGGFGGFAAWSEQILASEAAEGARLEKHLAAETEWLRTGVSARRRRNQGRLRRLEAARRERASRIGPAGQARLVAEAQTPGGRLAIEATHLAKRFGEDVIVRDFSCRILRGDRVGLIGRNGAGKTTLLKLLTGALAPDGGTLRLGSNLKPVWFDQRRDSLAPEATPWQILCPGGGDQVMVQGRPRHVAGYLRDFLFDEAQLRSPVKALSGGERNRLLLARILAEPANLLVLDEPTNDLDMETLDLLEEMLADYDGTLLLVSHDRDFLDRLVTSVIAVEGQGQVAEYVGGYSDYRRQRPAALDVVTTKAARPAGPAPATSPGRDATRPGTASRPGAALRLSYKDRRALDLLPGEIAALEGEIAALTKALDEPGFYGRDPAGFATATARLAQAQDGLAAAEEHWLDLAARAEALDRARGA